MKWFWYQSWLILSTQIEKYRKKERVSSLQAKQTWSYCCSKRRKFWRWWRFCTFFSLFHFDNDVGHCTFCTFLTTTNRWVYFSISYLCGFYLEARKKGKGAEIDNLLCSAWAVSCSIAFHHESRGRNESGAAWCCTTCDRTIYMIMGL